MCADDNDYWDSDTGTCGKGAEKVSIHDLWLNQNGTEGPASRIANNCPWAGKGSEGMGPASFNYSYVIGEGCVTGVDGDKWYGGFEDSVFEQHVLDFIGESPADEQPIFIFWAPQCVCQRSDRPLFSHGCLVCLLLARHMLE